MKLIIKIAMVRQGHTTSLSALVILANSSVLFFFLSRASQDAVLDGYLRYVLVWFPGKNLPMMKEQRTGLT
jgi:hypothetical protein